MCRSFVYTKEKRRKKDNKIDFSCSIFLTAKRINGTLGIYFTSKAAPKPYVQDTILNLLYSRSTTILLIPYVQDTILNLPNPYFGLCGNRSINGKCLVESTEDWRSLSLEHIFTLKNNGTVSHPVISYHYFSVTIDSRTS